MCSHVIDEDVQDQTLNRTTYWCLIEGSVDKDVIPKVIEFKYVNNSGVFTKGITTELPGITTDDQCHHYGYWQKYKELWVPLWVSKKCFVLDVSGGENNMDVLNGNGYDVGLGGAHVNFSDTLDLAIVTNHFDRFVSIIDRLGNVTNVDITQSTDTTVPVIGYWRQSHINSVTDDGLFFHIFAVEDGIFVEVDLITKSVSRTLYVGGYPIQSSS